MNWYKFREHIPAIPQNIQNRIVGIERKRSYVDDPNRTQWYCYFDKYEEDILFVLVAVHFKKWWDIDGEPQRESILKIAAIHAIGNYQCIKKDIYCTICGYYYEWPKKNVINPSTKWEVFDAKYFQPSALVMNPEFLQSTKFKYINLQKCCTRLLRYSTVSKSIRAPKAT